MPQTSLPEAHALPGAVRRPRAWWHDWGALLVLGFGIFVVLYCLWLWQGWGGAASRVLINDTLFTLATAAGVVLAARVARSPALDQRTRRAWAIMAVALAFDLTANALWLYYEAIAGASPFPSLADLFYLAFYPTLLAGLLTLPAAHAGCAERTRFWLDVGTVMVGAGMVIWYHILYPIAAASYPHWLTSALSLAYPVADLVLLFGVLTIVLGRTRASRRRALFTLSASLGFLFAADLLFAYQTLQGAYETAGWVDAVWMVGYFLLALSAQIQHAAAARDEDGVPGAALPGPRPLSLLPYVAVALGYGLLLLVLARQWAEPLGGLFVGAVALTALVIARQVADVREKTRLLEERAAVRAAAAEAVRRSEARFRSLVQNASDAVMVVDPQTAIRYQTPSVQRLLGYAEAQLDGVALLDLVHPDDGEHARSFFAQVAQRAGPSAPVAWRLRHRSGAWLEVETIATNLLGDADVRGIVLNTRDLSERRAKELAEAAMEAKSVFLATMSHELRTPLTAILGYAELIALEAAARGYTSLVPDLERIQASGRQLLTLIGNILDLTAIETGRMELSLETFAVAPLLEDVARGVAPLVAECGNRLVAEWDADLGVMRADPTRLRQLLYNLLSNAAKFTERGVITLRAERHTIAAGEGAAEGFMVFQVSDTGLGMTAEQLRYVFLPFAQADASARRRYGGSGLGLTLCRHFCTLMGGELRAESQPGVGSTFTVRLPIAAPSEG
ncbi:MAG TPA: ATP-binding protein [Roseiflexaceae bacterium]|nr:ATP-binding protein [Roseiflexaceae bacterium]